MSFYCHFREIVELTELYFDAILKITFDNPLFALQSTGTHTCTHMHTHIYLYTHRGTFASIGYLAYAQDKIAIVTTATTHSYLNHTKP